MGTLKLHPRGFMSPVPGFRLNPKPYFLSCVPLSSSPPSLSRFLSAVVVMKGANKHVNGYSPGDAFNEVPILPPLVEEAATSNTELWLVQLPVNELGPKDLTDKRWSMQLPDSGGKIGHFYSTRGEEFDVVKENMDTKKLYAMMPGSSQHTVRRITSKVCFRRHFEVQKEESPSGRTKSGVTTSEAKSRGDSTRSVQKRALPDEKQRSSVTEASIGNAEIEKESKKEKKKKKKEKKSKSEASN